MKSPGRRTDTVEESDALARIVAKNPSAPVSLLRVLSRSEDEATRKNVILNPFTPYDVLSELENQFTELFVTRVRTHYSHQMTAAARAIAAMKFLMLRSKRVAIRRQSLRRQNMRSMMLRCL